MPLPAGTRLGPYEVIAALGAGGMGEVYQARDTRLDRTVAVKFLAADVASDPEFRERFKREARSISALDHPHICALYDIGEHEGHAFLVMQHLEGETLAARLQRGPLPLDQALTCAIQIAGALDQAHRRGIVHRDLKPGNVMLTKTGAKLLDFGLAKTAPTAVLETASTALAESPRAGGFPLTAQGAILGTFQYMAPEQIEGRVIDARTDIFAFGALLYEMLTGRRAFGGQTQASLIAAILEREPPSVATVAPMIPPQLDHVVRRALAKDPDDRWQSARDLAGELQWISGQSSGQAPAVPRPRKRLKRLGPVLAGVALGAAIAAPVTWMLVPQAGGMVPVRAVVPLPRGTVYGIATPAFAISPDGRRIVYTAMHEGQPTLFVRSLDRFEAEPLRGTAGAAGPFFSPDSQHLGFFADAKLKRTALGAGLPIVICDAPDVRGASWGDGDVIVFAPTVDSGLMRVPASGGTPEPVTTRDVSKRERTHRHPHVLPGGGAVLFMIGTTDIPSYTDARIAVQSLAGGPPTVLVEGGMAPRYAAGHLFYSRGSVLMAAPFDSRRLVITGDAIQVAGELGHRSVFGAAEYDVSADGTLIYAPGGETQELSRLIWIDRSGARTSLDDAPRFHLQVQVSPDAQRLLLWVQGANDSMWVRDLRRGTLNRVNLQGNVLGGSWTARGQQIVFSLGDRIGIAHADGSSVDEAMLRDSNMLMGPMTSADGDTVFYMTIRPETGLDISRLSMSRRQAEPWVASRFNEAGPRPSPDGSMVLYTSDETGRREVFLRPAEGRSRVQVSTAGGGVPVWSHDGRTIYFVSGTRLYAVAVTPGQPPHLDVPRALFEVPPAQFTTPVYPWNYDVMPDGRFVFMETLPVPPPSELRLVQRALAAR